MRISSREISCSFFKVEYPANRDCDLLAALNDFATNCSTAVDRNQDIDHGIIRLHDWGSTSNTGSGTLLRLRTDGDARIGRIDTLNIEDLTLEENQGLVDFYCFKYYSETATIVLHRNRDVGSHKRLLNYLQYRVRLHGLQFNPIIEREAYERYRQMEEITVAEIKIAQPSSFEDIVPEDTSAGQAMDIMRDVGAMNLDIKLSMAHTRRSLILNRIKQLVEDFAGITRSSRSENDAEESRNSVVIRGRTDGGEIQVIDLVKERIEEKVAMRFGGPRPNMRDFYNAIDEAYSRRADEIQRIHRQW